MLELAWTDWDERLPGRNGDHEGALERIAAVQRKTYSPAVECGVIVSVVDIFNTDRTATEDL